MAREQGDVRRPGRPRRRRGGGGRGDKAVARPRQAFGARLAAVLREIGGTLEGVRPLQADALARAILRAERVYVAGAGRSGLVSSCFAMRLVHLGLVAHVVGEATAPGLGSGDLLVVSSGSGKTKTVIAQAKTAASRGARVAVVTADGGSPLARVADVVVEVPCPPFARPGKGTSRAGAPSIQPGGTLFEQSLLVFYDGLVLELADRIAWSPGMLTARHANLE